MFVKISLRCLADGIFSDSRICFTGFNLILTPDFLDTEIKFREKWKFPIPEGSAAAKHLEMKKAFEASSQPGV